MESQTITKIEESLRQIRGITSARIRVEQDEISEVHIVAGPNRRPKGIARDVVTTLFALHGLTVPHQRVSVAATQEQPAPPGNSNWPGLSVENGRRLLFRSVNVYREGNQAEAQVELIRGEQLLIGTASGPAIAQSLPRLVARATLQALGRVLGGSALELLALEERDLGGRRIMLCHLAVLRGRDENHFSGSVLITSDILEATVFSVLDGLNRFLAGQDSEEGIEYDVEVLPPEVSA